MMARQIRDGDEHDAYTSWRRAYVYLQRAGAVKKIKRRTHRRERREARNEIRNQIEGEA